MHNVPDPMTLDPMTLDPMTPGGGGAVTSPNELQQLDEDFAAGRLSPEDYRRRRGELRRAGTRQDANGTAAGAVQPANPFPPAFRWETSPSEPTTQVMQAVPRDTNGGDPAEATQVARTGDVQDWERTQAFAPNSSYQAYQASPSYQQRSGEVQDLFRPVDSPPVDNHAFDDSAPPWAGSDLPPIAEQPIAEQPIAEQQSAWMRKDSDVFGTPTMQSRSRQIIGTGVLAVLVVGLVGAGVAYTLSSGSPNQAASTQPALPQPNQPPLAPPPPALAPRELPPPPVPSPAPENTQQALIDPPGQSRGGGGLLDLPRLASGNLVPRPILNALRAGAMTDGVLKTTTVGSNTIGMFAFALRDEQAATDVANTIITVQRDGGLTVDDTRAQQGVAVLGTGLSAPSTVYRAAYVLYDRAILVEVFGSDRDSVLSTFDFVVNQQVTYAPPTVRGR
ncbi:MAG TPA: hypothetical protein VGO16_16575 [Pseudonocardiaceae bacterium]|nr:hypothetical protein [Pseudonocardiaceae bacterium]